MARPTTKLAKAIDNKHGKRAAATGVAISAYCSAPISLDPPPRMTDEESAAWRYLVGIAPDDLWRAADAPVVNVLARLHAKMLLSGELEGKELDTYLTLCKELGIGPRARSGIKVIKQTSTARSSGFGALQAVD